MTGRNSAPLRTVHVARASGYSVQQIRDLERLGVIPPAARSPNGYRSYTPVHIHALRAYRGLARAIGPLAARQLLPNLWAGTIADAAAAVSSAHVALAHERDEVLHAQAALHVIQAERTSPAAESADDAMTITELATALGVRTSTLRHWDTEGVVVPERVTSLRARRYSPSTIREARIVTALRTGGYGMAAIRNVMTTLRSLDELRDVESVLHRRLEQITARTVSLLRAGASLADVIEQCAYAERPDKPSIDPGAAPSQ